MSITFDRVEEAARSVKGEGWISTEALRKDPKWISRVANLNTLLQAAREGDDRATFYVKEAMASDDFPNLLGDTLNRQVRAKYSTWPSLWPRFVQRRTVNDYRTVKSFAPNALNSRWSRVANETGANAEFKNKADRSPVTYSVEDYAAYTSISRRTLINDDVGEFASMPDDMAQGARHTEDFQFTSAFIGSTGPTGVSTFTATNPVLSLAEFRAAYADVLSATDPITGEPIMIDTPILMVGPGNAANAREIVNAFTIDVHDDSTAAGANLRTPNWVKDVVAQVVVNPWIPIIDTTNAATDWLLFARPAPGRSALEAAFLRGAEQPRIYTKAQNKQSVGGGLASLTEGSFENDLIEYKGAHTFAFALVSAVYVYGSNGSGS